MDVGCILCFMETPGSPEKGVPQTETKPILTGGVPPIPPHNGPPVLTAIESGEDGDDPNSKEREAAVALTKMRYNMKRVLVRKAGNREEPTRLARLAMHLEGIANGIKNVVGSLLDI